MYLISDNVDTQTIFRLGGIEGSVVHTLPELNEVLDKIINDPEIIVCLITTKVFKLASTKFIDMKLNLKQPLFVEISDRHRSHEVADMIDETMAKIVGRVN